MDLLSLRVCERDSHGAGYRFLHGQNRNQIRSARYKLVWTKAIWVLVRQNSIFIHFCEEDPVPCLHEQVTVAPPANAGWGKQCLFDPHRVASRRSGL